MNFFEKQNKIAGGTYNPNDIRETLSTEFISFRERWNEETPHPDRSAIPGGRKMDGEEGRESIPRRRSMEQVVFSLPPPGEEAEPKPRAAPCERE